MSDEGSVRTVPRLPKNYELLRTIVEAEPKVHHTVHEIFVEARKHQPTIGYATVHRGLIRLCELDVILKIDVPGREAAWYEPAAPPHAHLLCDACHRVFDVDYHLTERALAGIAERGGHEITSEVVVFRGRCQGCKGSGAAASP